MITVALVATLVLWLVFFALYFVLVRLGAVAWDAIERMRER